MSKERIDIVEARRAVAVLGLSVKLNDEDVRKVFELSEAASFERLAFNHLAENLGGTFETWADLLRALELRLSGGVGSTLIEAEVGPFEPHLASIAATIAGGFAFRGGVNASFAAEQAVDLAVRIRDRVRAKLAAEVKADEVIDEALAQDVKARAAGS